MTPLAADTVPSAEHPSAPSRFLPPLILLMLAIMFSGAERYFVNLSHILHYGFDVVLVLAVIIIALAESRGTDVARSVGPYLAWLSLFFAWGTVVSVAPADAISQVASELILNALVIISIAVVVSSRQRLRHFAELLQLAVIANVLVIAAEATSPEVFDLLGELYAHLGPGAFFTGRPAGLWLQPNDAGMALVFAFLLATWARPPLRWLGRAAAGYGVYMSASKGAMYALVAVLFVLGLAEVRLAFRRRSRWLVIGSPLVAAILAVALVGLVNRTDFGAAKLEMPYPVQRFVDITSVQDQNDPSRLAIASTWLVDLSSNPWTGNGVFKFEGTETRPGAHNLYIAVWGDSGILFLLGMMFIFLTGASGVWRHHLHGADKLAVTLVWIVYIYNGFISHDQFFAIMLMVAFALALVLPAVLEPGSAQGHGIKNRVPTSLRA